MTRDGRTSLWWALAIFGSVVVGLGTWSWTTEGVVISRVLFAADGDLLVELRDGGLARTDAQGGAVRWRIETFGRSIFRQRSQRDDNGTITVAMRAPDGRPFVEAIGWSDGERRWLVEEQRADRVAQGHASSAVLPNGRSLVLVQVQDAYVLYSVDSVGQRGWTRDIPDEVMAGLVVANDRVFVVGCNALHLVDPTSGKLGKRWPLWAGGRMGLVGDELVGSRASGVEVEIFAIDTATLSERVIARGPSARSVMSVGRRGVNPARWVALTNNGPALSVVEEGGRIGGEGELFAWTAPKQSVISLYDAAQGLDLPFASATFGVLDRPVMPFVTWTVRGPSRLVWLDVDALSLSEDTLLSPDASSVAVRKLPRGWLVISSSGLQVRDDAGALVNTLAAPDGIGLRALEGAMVNVGDTLYFANQAGTVTCLSLRPRLARGVSRPTPSAPAECGDPS